MGARPAIINDRERACVPELQINFMEHIAGPVYKWVETPSINDISAQNSLGTRLFYHRWYIVRSVVKEVLNKRQKYKIISASKSFSKLGIIKTWISMQELTSPQIFLLVHLDPAVVIWSPSHIICVNSMSHKKYDRRGLRNDRFSAASELVDRTWNLGESPL